MNPKQDQHSHLFLVRFWKEGAQEAQNRKEWRGRVQHVLSGEARNFHDLPSLIDLLLEMAESEDVEGIAPRDRRSQQ